MTEEGEAVVTDIDKEYYHLVLVWSGRVVKAAKDDEYVKNKTCRAITDVDNWLKEAAGVDRIAEQIN